MQVALTAEYRHLSRCEPLGKRGACQPSAGIRAAVLAIATALGPLGVLAADARSTLQMTGNESELARDAARHGGPAKKPETGSPGKAEQSANREASGPHKQPLQPSASKIMASHPYLGTWRTADGHVRHQLLPGGRYDEARGRKESAYRGSYTITGNHIEYLDDTGFTADGDFIDGVLYHGGMVLKREATAPAASHTKPRD